MATSWDSANAKCPFYKSETKNSIICEGIAKYSSVNLTFQKSDGKPKQKKNHCNTDYSSCDIYKLLMHKYQ